MRRRARVDACHAEIVEALRRVGCGTLNLSKLGQGVPDILATKHGRYFLLEVKTAKGELTVCQERWLQTWPGPVAIIRSVEDALAYVRGSFR